MAFSFYQATSALISTPRLPLSRIAHTLGRHPHTIARARMQSEHGRSAPVQWERALAELASEHAGELEERAKLLRTLAGVLRQPEKA